MALARSKTVTLLIVTQMVSLLTLMLWFSLFMMVSKARVSLDVVSPLFLLYPTLPLALSVFAWIALRMKRYSMALICSLIPAIVGVLLMSYYFVIGLAQHTG